MSGFTKKIDKSTKFPEGNGIYTGDKNDDGSETITRQGMGKMEYYDKNNKIYKTYTGNCENNKKQGYGIETYTACKNLCGYYGNWKNNNKDGEGLVVSKHIHDELIDEYGDPALLNDKDYSKVHGYRSDNWVKALEAYSSYDMNITRKTIIDDLHSFQGEWNDGVITYGKIMYPNKMIYIGELTTEGIGFDLKAIAEGKGTMTYANGDVYEGSWKNNNKDGLGTMKYENGDTYIGYWYRNNKEGMGTMTYNNGEVYHGNWYIDHREGEGTMTYNNGDVYDGNWVSDKRHGQGTLTNNGKIIFDGNWYKDKEKLTKIQSISRAAKSVFFRVGSRSNKTSSKSQSSKGGKVRKTHKKNSKKGTKK